MSLKKRDSSLRVAANDPHLVSLGGGRLSTAVTIHYLPIGDTTIGSLSSCSITLNGSAVLPLHCTLYRSENNEVSIVPEKNSRILIDNDEISSEKSLTQGAMITIGNFNYLRFNNPAEAQLIKSTMGNKEPIGFEYDEDISKLLRTSDIFSSFHESYERKINSRQDNCNSLVKKNITVEYNNVNKSHSPKVFTADSITVNAPAKDVLGPKYASFAKNLVENHKTDKNTYAKNNEINTKPSGCVNISTNFIHNSSNSARNEILTKVNNNLSFCVGVNQISTSSAAYDKYPKSGSYGGLQLFPMNGLNSEINKNCLAGPSFKSYETATSESQKQNILLSLQEQERIDEIIKICTDYDKQHQNNSSLTSSPIVQNRIKTNGSLPRENKSKFHHEQNPQTISNHNKTFYSEITKSSGYENVRINSDSDRNVEIGNLIKSSYENVAAKYVPQSPRTKIRTLCISPKKEYNTIDLSNSISSNNLILRNKSKDYVQLVQSFENKLKLEMNAILEIDKVNEKEKFESNPKNTNMNNLKLNIENVSNENCTNRKDKELNELTLSRKLVLMKIRQLKCHIAEIQRQEDEVLRELEIEKALVTAELSTVKNTLFEMEKNMSTLQTKIFRLEEQRNATRVMQETQQSKLKQTIQIKQDQSNRLKKHVENNISDTRLKEELKNCTESLENDTKAFEDFEFQFLEEEIEWLSNREELYNEAKLLAVNIEKKKTLFLDLQDQTIDNQNIASEDAKTLGNNLFSLLKTLKKNRDILYCMDKKIHFIKGQQNSQSDQSDDEDFFIKNSVSSLMSQSLIIPVEIDSTKTDNVLMSKSFDENMFYNQTETLFPKTSTPTKELILHAFPVDIHKAESLNITPELIFRGKNNENDPILKLKYGIKSEGTSNRGNFNSTLGSDDFVFKKRIPSPDDIDRISKITSETSISTKGANNKIFESIKEIERNRLLLLAQQGSNAIEHEGQKMLKLKKTCHNEAQYLSTKPEIICNESLAKPEKTSQSKNVGKLKENETQGEESLNLSQNRYSHPTQLPIQRPLSEVNSESSYNNVFLKPFKSSANLVSYNFSASSEDAQRSSIHSNETTETDILICKRNLPKHQRPLTRYLPIMSPYLDLKLHIESAGHQPALCSFVYLDSFSCRGYLHKLGSTFHTWSRRWFVLNRQRKALIYYADKNEKKPRGGACFRTIDEVYLDHLNSSRSGRPSCTFIVKTKKRSFHLQSASDEAARIWIDAIITGAQGNIGFD